MNQENKIPIIEVRNLNVIHNQGKTNEVRSLENFNLDIFPEEYVIVFGPSGCGKSTLLYVMAGLATPTSGTVKVGGRNISEFSRKEAANFHQKSIGMIFQSFFLIPSLNVLKNVCLPKLFGGENKNDREQSALRLLERFGIANQSEKFPAELSGGQKQRTSIARALVNNPEIILADEPVGNLDSKSAYNVMLILKELNEKDKKTVILVTHDPAHLEYGDKVVHMQDGKIIKIDVVKKKKDIELKNVDLESDLFRRGVMKEEFVPADLRLLMRSFKNFSLSQIGNLLVPFKAQQLFAHIFFSITDEQIDAAKKKLSEVLYSRISFGDFFQELDRPMEKGGAGWDRRFAKHFSQRAEKIMKEADQIDFSQIEKSASVIADYISKEFNLKFDYILRKKLLEAISARLANRSSMVDLLEALDKKSEKEGVGLDKRTAEKIAREVEILLLLRYSS